MIVFFIPTLPSYRKELFCKLSEDFDLKVIAGAADKRRKIDSITSLEGVNISLVNRFERFGFEHYALLGHYQELIFASSLVLNFRRGSWQQLLLLLIRKILGRRSIYWGNNFRSKKTKLLYIYSKFYLSLFDEVVGYSPSSENFGGFKGVFHPSINVSDFVYRCRSKRLPVKERSRERNTHRILFVGTVKPSKNLDALISAVASVRAIHDLPIVLDVVGSEREANTPAFVNFWGRLSFDNLPEVISDPDVFVLPGLGGLSVIDALYLGMSVISTSGDGTLNYWVRQLGLGVALPDNPSDSDIMKELVKHYTDFDKAETLRRKNQKIFHDELEKTNLDTFRLLFKCTIS